MLSLPVPAGLSQSPSDKSHGSANQSHTTASHDQDVDVIRGITRRGECLDLNCTPFTPTLCPLPTKIVVWRQGFFLSFACNYAPFHLPPCSPWPLLWGQWPGYPTLLRPIMCLLGWMKRGHSCQGRQESSEESNHSITLCPRLSRLLPEHPNAPPRRSHQRPGPGPWPRLRPWAAQRATVRHRLEKKNCGSEHGLQSVETPESFDNHSLKKMSWSYGGRTQRQPPPHRAIKHW